MSKVRLMNIDNSDNKHNQSRTEHKLCKIFFLFFILMYKKLTFPFFGHNQKFPLLYARHDVTSFPFWIYQSPPNFFWLWVIFLFVPFPFVEKDRLCKVWPFSQANIFSPFLLPYVNVRVCPYGLNLYRTVAGERTTDNWPP